jgi:SAM-dependent methyltransferase
VLDVGSSTAEFRTRVQPHIHDEIFAPLEARGVSVVHLDAKDGDGVDVTYDLTDPAIDARAALGRWFDAVLCCNLLEHVVDRAVVARAVSTLVAPGGWLIVTVPRRYRRHHDPIDTMYRPMPNELSDLFAGVAPFATVRAGIVRVDRRRYYRPFPGASRARRVADAGRWLVPALRWRQSCVVLQRSA